MSNFRPPATETEMYDRIAAIIWRVRCRWVADLAEEHAKAVMAVGYSKKQLTELITTARDHAPWAGIELQHALIAAGVLDDEGEERANDQTL